MIRTRALALAVASACAFFAYEATADDNDVTVKRDLSYYDGQDRDPKKNAVDLYVPKGAGPFPVLAWVHGGGWKIGDRSQYRNVGQAFAKQGILTALVGYRLTPKVVHPEHVKDVARALAWLKKNVKEHGGDPEKIFVSGHSAGGHLSALVALDPKYLKEQGLELSSIRGVIPMSGPFGTLALATFGDAFPQETREDAAPINHVSSQRAAASAETQFCPPFFITWGDDDPINLRFSGKQLAKKLTDAGAKAKSLEVKDRNHLSMVAKIGSEKDELTEAVAKFIKEVAAEKPWAGDKTDEKKPDSNGKTYR